MAVQQMVLDLFHLRAEIEAMSNDTSVRRRLEISWNLNGGGRTLTRKFVRPSTLGPLTKAFLVRIQDFRCTCFKASLADHRL
jgi:hypothetical protein